MKRTVLAPLSAAVVAGAIVLAGALAPTALPAANVPGRAGVAATAPARKLGQIRGFSMQLTSSKPEMIDAYLKSIDELADMGCTWVNFVIAGKMDNVHSEAISIPWQDIPDEKSIQAILRKAKTRKMGVMMMPIVLLTNSGSKDWRGVIAPPNWDNWFASYNSYITYMAHLANSCDVDVFCVGSELLSTEPMRDKWVDTIAQIKLIYPGKLTYSANWDHYTVPTFWDQLDYVGMNNYNELASDPGVSLKDLDKAWEPIKRDILDFVAKQKKPFMFTEVGWHNLHNTIKEPWNYVATGEIDLAEQARAFQSFVDTWGNVKNDQFMGAYVWEWFPGASGVTTHGTYSLQGTPALEVVKKWMVTR